MEDKAPGPNGFYGVFQECWETIKDELVNIMEKFHITGKFARF